MSNTIDSAVSAALAAAPVRAATGARDHRDAASRPARPDSVVLTGEAQSLQQLERLVAAQDGIDADRVASIKRQVADGSYAIDAQVIAGKLLQSEVPSGSVPGPSR